MGDFGKRWLPPLSDLGSFPMITTLFILTLKELSLVYFAMYSLPFRHGQRMPVVSN